MKKLILSMLVLLLAAGTVWAQAPNPDAGWTVFVIREANDGITGPPAIVDNDDYVTDAIEFGIVAGGQKAALATNLINGAKVSSITGLHVDRLDDVASSGSLYGPYFNIWVTDGLGNYAVVANEPSNGAWAADRWDVPDWTFLQTKVAKVYETPGWNTGTSWVHTHALANGWDGVLANLTFDHVAGLTVSPPPPAYIADGANGVGSGAPDELGTNIAYGFNWMFGDTAANYVSGGDGFIVDNYTATATFAVQNVTQGTSYPTIEAALAAAADFDLITIDDGTYNPPNTLAVGRPLTITGQSEAGVIINIPAAGSYGMTVTASDVTLENFTLATNAGNEQYPIHASGTSNPPNGFDNLTIRNVTISGAHRRTCLDVHGFNNLVVSGLTASDSWGGNGLQLTGVVGATVDNVTTLGNAWGSLAIYCSNGTSYLGRGSDGVTIDGASCSFGEGVVFTQDEFGLTNTNTVVTSYLYNVRNFNFRPDAAGYVFFQDTEANAIAHALGLDATAPGSWITAIGGGSHIVAAGMGIQFAIDGALPGDMINVAAGHFEEQLHFTTDGLSLVGAGVGATFVDAPNSMPLFFTTSADNYPVVFVDGAMGTAISGLTIDGQGYGATNYRFIGLGLYNADGIFADLAVTRTRDEPLSGAQHGIGLYVFNDDAAARTVSFTDVSVTDSQKNATTWHGAGLDVVGTRVSCTGNGPLGVGLPAQNGIQVSGGASAVLTDCAIADYNYTDPAWTATGLLVYGPGTTQANGGTISGCKTSVYYIDGSGGMDGYSVTDTQGDPLYAYSSGAKAAAKATPQPLENPGPLAAVNKAPLTFLLTNSTFTGSDVVDSWGPTAYAAGPVDFTMTGCTVEHFDNGLNIYEAGGTVTGSASGNNLIDNVTYGAWSNSVVPYDARGNWWGTASGPLHPIANPFGGGNEVSDNILFEPWTGMAAGDIVPVSTGPINCTQTVTLTFNYTADGSTPDMFLYNAVVSATAGLDFGTVTDLLPFGTVNNNFFSMVTGPNQWTITGSTVGSPTSPVSGAGTTGLFSIEFSATADVIGSVVFDSLVLRDPDNNPIPVALTGADITYDCTAPAGVTAITAAPGHNKVGVDWTHDGTDVAYYRVYRGLWHNGAVGTSAYPEYDDDAPATPAVRPVSPAAANLDPEWELADIVAVGTNAYTDAFTYGPNSRGVYTYEVFTEDAAGNVSPAAPANDRATNYWLGDVATSGPGDPDGEVGVPDMTALGTAFGTSEAGGGLYNNIIDVGPTDDWSRLGIPLTDNLINFEDLMIFSLNFGVVASAKTAGPVSSSIGLAWVTYEDGSQALRLVNGAGLKGVRVTADQRLTRLEAGLLLDEQSELTFLQNVGEKLDVSVAVMGVNQDFQGSGDLFVLRADEGLSLSDLTITARSITNAELKINLDATSDTALPRVFNLHANYPNPFNPMTKISFSLPEAQAVNLGVYSVDGRRIATLINETRDPGLHEVVWTGRNDDGQSVASGLYFYKIDAGPYSQVRKMTLMK